jgi:succinate-semialdehyde dehydrogenase/glutarate-semialdehyde dehydrogenase
MRLALKLAEPLLLRGAALIDGKWVAGERGIEVLDPASGKTVGRVPDLGEQHAREAVGAASIAFAHWRSRTAGERGSALIRWAALMLRHANDLARLLTAEQGKPLAEAKGEVAYAASFLQWFGEEAKRVRGELLTPHASDKRLVVARQPIGVVAAITPWNFPLAMITRKAGPALAAGCTMVLKPSELTPLSALALGWLASEAGVPPGVFNVVTGTAEPIGRVLTEDPRVRKFTFTGSTGVGKMLAARCMASVKRVSLELGGNAPFIVFDDADLNAAAAGVIASKFRNTGQTCVCANRLLVQSGVYDRFVELLRSRVEKLIVGPGLDGLSDQGPLIDDRAVARVRAHVDDAIARGGRVIAGGQRLDRDGTFFAPTIIANVSPEAVLCREETFGPVAGLVRFETEQQVLEMANDTTAGLAAYFYTRDLDRSWRVAEALEYGMVGINSGLVSTEVAPFGGVKESGLGREGSHLGIDEYLDTKLRCFGVADEAL